MRRTLALSAIIAISGSLGVVGTAEAQGLGPVRGAAIRPTPAPAFSPYLNLLRRGTPTFLNYHGLVRPQLEFQQSVTGLRQDIANNQAAIQNVTAPDGTILPTTGHRSFFMNTAGYFQSIGGAAGPGGLSAGFGVSRPTTTSPTGAGPSVPGGVSRPMPAGGGGAVRPAGGGRR
jgi:hypothetical protein